MKTLFAKFYITEYAIRSIYSVFRFFQSAKMLRSIQSPVRAF